ncbi:MAG: Holliday junction resolvase RuvX [Bacteroidales bacterium]
MGRILAIDYGKKRVGVAVTDPLRIIASPLVTLPAAETESFLKDYLSKEVVDEIVIGYPVTLNNKPSEAVKYIDPFINRLLKLFPLVPVNRQDERFTSSMAKQVIIDGGVKKKSRQDKTLADKISASIILQSYLDRKRFENKQKEK